MKKIYSLLVILSAFGSAYSQTNTYAGVAGNWSATGNWSLSHAPVAGEDVVIPAAAIVTIDVTAAPGTGSINSLTISGNLTYAATLIRTVTVANNVTINAGGSFSTVATGTATHKLVVGGNIINNGILDFNNNSNAQVANITFTGAANQTVSGTGATTDFFSITMTKSALDITGATNMVDINLSNFSVNGLTTGATGALLASNSGTGLLKISGSNNFSGSLWSTATYIVPATLGFWLNNPNFTVSGMAGTATLSGFFRITNGVYNIGTAVGNSMTSTGTVIIEGGAINTAAKFQNTGSYTQSAGTLTTAIIGNNSSASGSFQASGSFTMSGGNIVLQNKATGATQLDYNISAAAPVITGGVLQIGNGATPAANSFKIQGKTPNIVLNNSSGNNPGFATTAAVIVMGDITLNGSGTFTKGAFPLTMLGNSVTNPGNITVNGTNTLTLNTSPILANAISFTSPTGNQLFSLNAGTITAGELPSLTINNSFASGTVTISTGLSMTSGTTLTLSNGRLNAGASGTGTLSLGTAAAGTFTCIRTLGSLQAATVGYGTGTTIKSYTYDGPGSVIPGPELTTAASVTIDALTVNNATLKLALNKPVNVNASLVLSNGIIKTATTNQLMLGSVAATGVVTGGSASSYISGRLIRMYAAGSIGSGSYSGSTFCPVGNDSVYLPIYVDASTSGSGAAQLQIEGFDTNTGTNISPVGATLGTHRWEVLAINGTSGNVADGIYIKMVDAMITATNNIMSAVSGAGVYSSIVPQTTKSTGAVYTNFPGITAAAFNSNGYFSFGDGCNPLAGPNNICTGASAQLVASTGSNVATTGVWSSSAPGVASIDAMGNITPVNLGITTITFAGNNATDACNLVSLVRIVTITTCNGAPGGVSTGLHTFIKADLGVTGSNPVTGWTNQSTGTTVLVNGQPTLSLSLAYNYNPVINFTAPVSPRQYLTLSGFNNVAGINYAGVFMAANITDLTRVYTHMATVNGVSGGTPQPNGIWHGGNNGGSASLMDPASDADFVGTNIWRRNGEWVSSSALHLTAPHMMSAVSYTGTSTLNRFFGGQDDNIGAGFYGNTRDWRGPVAELIGYTTAPSAANRVKIESYLALKYGFTLGNSAGGTAGDYVLSDGSTVWSASVNPAFQRQVIGLVRDDASALMQKQSHTQDDSLRLFIGGLAVSNQANTNNLSNDKSSIVVGNDGGVLKNDQAATRPPTILYRMGRTWKVTNTSFNNNFGIEIKWDSAAPFFLSDIRLLVSNSPDFSSAAVYSSYDVNFYIGSIIVTGIGPSIIPPGSTKYITIGSVSTFTTLGADITQFTATPVDNKWVKLNWQTDAEKNNEYFTIEKSADGKTWKTVTTVNGAGNSSVVNTYSVVDKNPYTGVSYYRLKQIDIDGKYSYSPIRNVTISAGSDNTVVLYPNPAAAQVTVKGKAAELKTIKIFNITGQDVTGMTKIIASDNTGLVMDVSALTPGVYSIKTSTTVTKLSKK